MPDRLVAQLLKEWREADRALEAIPTDAPPEQYADAQRRVDSLRTAYHEAARVLELIQRAERMERLLG